MWHEWRWPLCHIPSHREIIHKDCTYVSHFVVCGTSSLFFTGIARIKALLSHLSSTYSKYCTVNYCDFSHFFVTPVFFRVGAHVFLTRHLLIFYSLMTTSLGLLGVVATQSIVRAIILWGNEDYCHGAGVLCFCIKPWWGRGQVQHISLTNVL